MEKIIGLETFLYGLLELIKRERIEKVSKIDSELNEGVATYLYTKYRCDFDSVGFEPSNLNALDEYYKNYVGIADSSDRKYKCDRDDGIYLLIKLIFDNLTRG